MFQHVESRRNKFLVLLDHLLKTRAQVLQDFVGFLYLQLQLLYPIQTLQIGVE
jgi:hypothetical protein